ncbi:hypothetical protein RchiOBHm_Chr7g0177731 [Rosa chinensis]|uniref:CASP-like protein n=1 Tax=Rosa chinensis TaxID=74649 RepID=A0A2P6P1M9_ROSCH|nr:CASP-like protein 4D1 [Rosa chinensis]PRQ15834.1 hypothetical protein RchiOBHm_Chr7g0177731 [Rosa chinensis]
MASEAIPCAVLVFRIFTLAACVASGWLLVLDHFTISNQKLRFQDLVTFRYVLSAAVIGAAYSILQLPFNIYYASTQKRLIRNGCMPEFDFFADKVVSLILSSAVGAGFGAGVELKKFIEALLPLLGLDNLREAQTKNDDFYEKAIVATGILLVGAVCMAVVSILTSIARTPGFFGYR